MLQCTRLFDLRLMLVVVVLGAVAVWPLNGQAPAVFRAGAYLVVVDVTVRNSRGETVMNLDRSAFTVYENGKPQPIALFLGENAPVSLGMVIDNSSSVRLWRPRVEAAALAFGRASNPVDEVFVVNFADKPHIDVPLTSDLSVLEAGIARVDSIGGTALRDAVDLAETYLTEHATHDRKVLLLITDGNDNASTTPVNRIRQQAEHRNIAIYAIGLPHHDPSKAGRARRELDQLTEGTGGFAVHLSSMDDVASTAVDLAHQVRQQYMLAYTPLNQVLDGSYRRIRVVVKPTDGLSVRTRTGYFATPRSSVIRKGN